MIIVIKPFYIDKEGIRLTYSKDPFLNLSPLSNLSNPATCFSWSPSLFFNPAQQGMLYLFTFGSGLTVQDMVVAYSTKVYPGCSALYSSSWLQLKKGFSSVIFVDVFALEVLGSVDIWQFFGSETTILTRIPSLQYLIGSCKIYPVFWVPQSRFKSNF